MKLKLVKNQLIIYGNSTFLEKSLEFHLVLKVFPINDSDNFNHLLIKLISKHQYGKSSYLKF